MNRYMIVAVSGLAVALVGCNTSKYESKAVASKSSISPEIRECPDWSSDPVSNYSNEDFSNHGCSTTHNLYVQLKDKKDYNRGTGKSGVSANRDSTFVQTYMNGAGSGAASSSSAAPASSTSR